MNKNWNVDIFEAVKLPLTNLSPSWRHQVSFKLNNTDENSSMNPNHSWKTPEKYWMLQFVAHE